MTCMKAILFALVGTSHAIKLGIQKDIKQLSSAKRAEPLLFIGVVTAPDHFGHREALRKTWATLPAVKDGVVAYRFMIGELRGGEKQASLEPKIREEAEAHNDIVRLVTPEGYGSLTKKTGALLKYFNENVTQYPHLMKLDDDAFPHLNRIIPYLTDSKEEHLYAGLMLACKVVAREGKWGEKPQYFNDTNVYPKYAHGPSYILSRPLVRNIAKLLADDADQLGIYSEDAAVGAWVKHVNSADAKVKYAQLPTTAYGCSEFDYMSQNVGPKHIEEIWANAQKHADKPCGSVKGTLGEKGGYIDWGACH